MSTNAIFTSHWERLFGELAALNIQVQTKEVCSYLDAFPDIADVVPAIARSARAEFGPDAGLFLEVNRDPEIDDKYLKLRVSLRTLGTNIDDRLDAVSDAHEDKLRDKKGYILVTTGPQLRQ